MATARWRSVSSTNSNCRKINIFREQKSRLTSSLCATKCTASIFSKSGKRFLSTEVAVTEHEQQVDIFCSPKTAEHKETDIGKFYNLPSKEIQSIFPSGVTHRFNKQIKALKDCHLMVRKPSLDVIQQLSSNNQSSPRFIIFFKDGKPGIGKTLCTYHIIHHCKQNDWLIVNVPYGCRFVQKPYNYLLQVSSWNEDRFDQPDEATEWLQAFKATNANKLAEIECSKDYSWGKRDGVEKGSSLASILDQGLTRTAYATDTVGILLKEIQLQKKYQVLYSVDQFNSFYSPNSMRYERNRFLTKRLSLVHHFTKLLNQDSSLVNGAYVLSLSAEEFYQHKPKGWKIEDLLEETGIEAVGDFTPVEVERFDDLELSNYLLYMQNKGWLNREINNRLRDEVIFLTERNPLEVSRLCSFA